MGEIIFVSNQYECQFAKLTDEKYQTHDLKELDKSNYEFCLEMTQGTYSESKLKFLLWGTVVEVENGWSLLREASVPDLWVPLSGKIGKYVYLQYCEELRTDHHGNVSVIKQTAFELVVKE